MVSKSPLVLAFVLLILPLICAYVISVLCALFLAIRESVSGERNPHMSGEFPGMDRDNSLSTWPRQGP
jgi:hypothetical protein